MRIAKPLILLLIYVLLSAFKDGSSGGCTTEYYPMATGNEFELQNFDTKDKLESRIHYTVTKGENITGGYQADIKVDNYDKKDKLMSTSNMSMKCENSTFYIDMSMFIPAETMDAYKNMQMTMSGNSLEFPSSLTVGQSLPDASITMTVSNQGMNVATIKLDIINRKVEGKESVTVPAGTFDSYKISSDSKMVIGTVIPMTTNMHGIEWLSLGNGMVRSENYSDKGKLQGYTVLSMLKK